MARTGRAFPSHISARPKSLAATEAVTYTYIATGGITFSGSATLSRTFGGNIAAGGIVFAGSASISRTFGGNIATGGIIFAGTGTHSLTKAITATGGIVFAGSATVLRTLSSTGSGVIVFSGSAILARTIIGPVSGGIVFGGAGTYSVTYTPPTPIGGITFGGSATTLLTHVFPYTSTGGIIFGGSATAYLVHRVAGTGGIVFGGSATVTLILTTPTLAQIEGATRNEIFKRFLRETGLGTYGIVTGVAGGATTTLDDTTRLKSTQFNADMWKGGWVRISKNADAPSTSPENEVKPITISEHTTNGRLTFNPALSANLAVGDEYEIWRFPNPTSVIEDLDVVLREDVYLPCWTVLSEAPDFDMEQNNLTDWTADGITIISKASGEPSLDGARWLALTTYDVGAAGSVHTANEISVEPGKKYHSSVVGYNRVGVTLTLEAYDVTNSATIDSKTWDGRYPGRIHFEFTTPNTCKSLRIYLRHSAGSGSLVSYWDEFCLYPVDAYDIALPWWVKNKSQIKGIFKLTPNDISANVYDSAIRGEFFQDYEIRDNAFGRGQLRLVVKHGSLPGILFMFGVRNEVAFTNDTADVKRVDENFIIAALAVKVFRRLKTFPNSNAMQTTWIQQQYDEWEKRYKQLQRQQSERLEEIERGYRFSGQYIDERFAFNR